MFTKPRRSSVKPINSIPNSNHNSNSKLNHLKSKKGKTCPHCTHPKCMKIGHMINHCWAEGGSSEGQQPIIPRNSHPGNGPLARDSGKKMDGKVAVLIAHNCAAVADHCHDP